MSSTWQPWTEDNERLAREFDRYMGLAPSGSGARNLAEEEGEDDGPTPEERALADEFDRYTRKPSRENAERADPRFRRDYTQLDAEGIGLALQLDHLTNVRP